MPEYAGGLLIVAFLGWSSCGADGTACDWSRALQFWKMNGLHSFCAPLEQGL